MSILDGKFIKAGTIPASALEISPDFVLENRGGIASFITTNDLTHSIIAGNYNTILGGQENTINAAGNYNLLISGRNNLIEDSATQVARDSFIIAGGGTSNFQNHIIGSVVSAILGGTGNTIGTSTSVGNFNNFIINSLNSAIGSDSDLVTVISSTNVTTDDAVDNAVGIGLQSYNMTQSSTIYMPKVRLGLGTGGGLTTDNANTNVLVINSSTGEIEINTTIAGGLSTTDDLTEGSVNFYYTETRFNTSFSSKNVVDLLDVTDAGSGQIITVVERTQISDNQSGLSNHITDFNNPHNVIAVDVSYQNGTSGLVATNVQDAIDELDTKIDIAAGTNGYLNAIVEDTSPELGGNLVTAGNQIHITDTGKTIRGIINYSTDTVTYTAVTSTNMDLTTSSGNISISSSAGNVKLNNLAYPKSDGQSGQLLSTDGAGTLDFSNLNYLYAGTDGRVELESTSLIFNPTNWGQFEADISTTTNTLVIQSPAILDLNTDQLRLNINGATEGYYLAVGANNTLIFVPGTSQPPGSTELVDTDSNDWPFTNTFTTIGLSITADQDFTYGTFEYSFLANAAFSTSFEVDVKVNNIPRGSVNSFAVYLETPITSSVPFNNENIQIGDIIELIVREVSGNPSVNAQVLGTTQTSLMKIIIGGNAGTAGTAQVQSFDTNVFNDYKLLFENSIDTGYQFKTLELELTSTQILSLGTSPIEVLPINTDKFIVPIKGIYTTIGRNFYSNQTLELIFEGDSSGSYIFKDALSASRPGKRRMTFMHENQDNSGVYADAALLLRAKDGIDPVGRGHSGILKLLYALVD